MSERFAWIYDEARGVKTWVADMWSRKAIRTLQQSKQDALDQTQLAAVNSGITAEIVTGKFAVVDGTCASDGNYGTDYPYPTGFTFDNSVVLSLSILYTSNWYYAGDGVLSTSGRLAARLSQNGISVRQSQSTGYGVPFRVVLMRTDI